jgi:uncharacterized protein
LSAEIGDDATAPTPKPKPVGEDDAGYVVRIAAETKIPVKGVMAVAQLLGEGGTVPFIARYRKEKTGELDEVQITTIRDRLEQLRELDSRRTAILKSLEENKHLTPELRAAVEKAGTLTALEDIYAPFRPKRRTRATVAKERGLEPLADFLLANPAANRAVVAAEAAKYIVTADTLAAAVAASPAPPPADSSAPLAAAPAAADSATPAPAAADSAAAASPLSPADTKKAADAQKDKLVPDAAFALAGARDIIAERVSDAASARAACRDIFTQTAILKADVIKGKEEEGAKFKDYFEWEESLEKAPSHRVLAIRRGEKEGFLSMRIIVEEEAAFAILERQFIPPGISPEAAADGTPLNAAAHIRDAVHDSWKRLLGPSLETEARLSSKKRAEEAAIHVFADNIGKLLMAPALGQKNTLALDPGFRTGCKLVVLDAQGKLLHHEVIFPTTGSKAEIELAGNRVRILCHQHKVQAISIGNGTASRETEAFVRSLGIPAEQVPVVTVNESGASIYSASEVAREEFPKEDVTVRGAVSIGRRLQDPLAELVKIDPKSIGVGQYQHDVDQTALKRSLDDVVTSCVNRVGVELNTASKQLLSYVSGLNANAAANIVAWRNENGAFKSRDDLKKVPRLGPKAFEQSAGFLRIRDGAHPLDASSVHPERYALVEKMAADAGVDVPTLLRDAKARAKVELEKYISADVGLPTLEDIVAELEKPGRDPREKFEVFNFAEGVHEMKDLQEGQKLPGIVTNVTAFGAFVDIGVHQDGLLHISQISDNYIKDPSEVLQVGQKVSVTVLEVDIPRRRISLSMKTNPQKDAKNARDTFSAPNKADAFQRGEPRRGGGGGPNRNYNDRARPEAAPTGKPRSWSSHQADSFNNPFANIDLFKK